MPITTLTDFHHWLLAEETDGAPFILLETGDLPRTSCAAAVARHLNEFDETSGGNWVALDSEVIQAIANDPAQRKLIGLNGDTASPPCLAEVFAALARRGHIVINHPGAKKTLAGHRLGFLAALGVPPNGGEGFHIILDPNAFPARCLAPLIADIFLEWFNHLTSA